MKRYIKENLAADQVLYLEFTPKGYEKYIENPDERLTGWFLENIENVYLEPLNDKIPGSEFSYEGTCIAWTGLYRATVDTLIDMFESEDIDVEDFIIGESYGTFKNDLGYEGFEVQDVIEDPYSLWEADPYLEEDKKCKKSKCSKESEDEDPYWDERDFDNAESIYYLGGQADEEDYFDAYDGF